MLKEQPKVKTKLKLRCPYGHNWDTSYFATGYCGKFCSKNLML